MLQKHFFPNLKNVFDIRNRDEEFFDFLGELTYDHPLFVDIQEARALVDKRIAEIDEQTILISREQLFGTYSAMENETIYYSNKFVDNKHNTEILKGLFEKAKIIIIIRRQDTWIESIYNAVAIQGSRNVSFAQFLNPDGRRRPYFNKNWSTHSAINPRCIDWLVYVKNYINEFGPENVLVLPIEMLRNSREEFYEKLCKFISTETYIIPEIIPPENRGFSKLSSKIATALKPFIHTKTNRCGIIPDRPFIDFLIRRQHKNFMFRILTAISVRLSVNWILRNIVDRICYSKPEYFNSAERDTIKKLYAKSNEELETLIGVDLKKYGYY